MTMAGGHLLGKCETEKRGETDDLIGKSVAYRRAFQVASSEKAMAPHSSTLAWKIPWMENPGGLQSVGS